MTARFRTAAAPRQPRAAGRVDTPIPSRDGQIVILQARLFIRLPRPPAPPFGGAGFLCPLPLQGTGIPPPRSVAPATAALPLTGAAERQAFEPAGSGSRIPKRLPLKSYVMEHFTLSELIRSETARRLGLDNTPREEHRRNLRELAERLLDPLREAWTLRCRSRQWGTPAIRITSGYRCEALNKAVGGAPASAHRYGLAADLAPANGRMAAFRDCCAEFLQKRDFDQLISEREDAAGTPCWVHVGYRSADGRQRRQMLALRQGTYYPFKR